MTFIYSESKVRDKKLLEKARQLSKSLRTVDIEKEKLSPAHFTELSSARSGVRDLLDPRIIEGYDIKDAQDALHMINKKPELLKTPVLVANNRLRFINDLEDLQHLIQMPETGENIQL